MLKPGYYAKCEGCRFNGYGLCELRYKIVHDALPTRPWDKQQLSSDCGLRGIDTAEGLLRPRIIQITVDGTVNVIFEGSMKPRKVV